jgi:hypothetical protein
MKITGFVGTCWMAANIRRPIATEPDEIQTGQPCGASHQQGGAAVSAACFDSGSHPQCAILQLTYLPDPWQTQTCMYWDMVDGGQRVLHQYGGTKAPSRRDEREGASNLTPSQHIKILPPYMAGR